MLDHMNLLSRFHAIAEAGSVRRAADRLHITQPALSRSLRQLELHYGQPLLERHARGVRATAFGSKLLATISRVSREWELAELELKAEGSAIDGVLRISSGPLWSGVVLPVVATRLQRLFPNLSLEIGFITGDAAMSALIDGRLDLMLGGLPKLDRGMGNIASHQFTSVRDRVVARADHPIQACHPLDYGAVHDYPWITYAVDSIYEAETLHAIVERTGMAPNIRVRSTSLLSVIRLLQEGDYLCMLPDAFAAGVSGPPLRPVPVELGRRVTNSGVLYRKSIANFEPLRVLIELCTAYFEGSAAASVTVPA
jgi:DNA-binding transcriptional LysR family regulator